MDLLAVPGPFRVYRNWLASRSSAGRENRRVRSLNLSVPVSNLNYNFAANFQERAINHKDAARSGEGIGKITGP